MREATPTQDNHDRAAAGLTVVALGASAGGLEALRAFFGAVRPHPAIAYVVVTHLPTSHASHLDDLLGRIAALPVTQAVDGQPVEADHIYLNTPGTLLGIRSGRLTLEAAGARALPSQPVPMPIDHFMAELADDLGAHSVGIVLSGTGHDGTAGLRAIRSADGLALVQSPDTAEFSGMPASAITAGVGDRVLAAQDMPAALLDYLAHEPLDWMAAGSEPGQAQRPRGGAGGDAPVAAGAGEAPPGDPDDSADEPLLAVLRLLQVRTGHDFRDYRPAMLRRRLRRRMGLCKVVRVADYLARLEGADAEVEALKNEFLIGVTDFFRDPQAWEELVQLAIAPLVAQRTQDDAPIRVWTPGCATGEESYSIAMLLLEQAEGKIDPQRIHVFGTDIDLDALAVARSGRYPASIAASVSARRLTRFFDLQGDHYMARKTLRSAIMFAPQDLVRDTPFSRLDLVICRNLLIYFKPALQARVLALFHYALKPGGVLMLGKAESVGPQTALFAPASSANRVYRRIGERSHLPVGFGARHAARAEAAGALPPAVALDPAAPSRVARQALADALDDAERSNEDLRTANEESLALNEELQSSNEELESSKEELESLNEELTSVNAQLDEKLSELAQKNDDLHNLLVNTGLATILLDAGGRIRRFTPAASEIYSLQPGDEGRLLADISSRVSDPEFAADLRRVAESGAMATAEVRSVAGCTYLRRIQPYRTQAGSTEGAVLTFTDITALRDAAQRQRELFAVLQDSNDAIILHDPEGRILAWNAGAERIYGHPASTVLGTLLYELMPEAERGPARERVQRVVATGQGDTQESRRLCRDGVTLVVSVTTSALRGPEGAVYALISTERDISLRLRSESEMYFRRLADRIPVLLRVEDTQGSAQFVNQPCCAFTGRPREALLGQGWLEFIHPEDRLRYLAEQATALPARQRLETDLRMRRADGAYRWMRSINVPHYDGQEAFVGYIGLMLDVEDHKVAEAALRDADRRKDDFLAMLAHELRNPLAPIRTAVAVITRTAAADPTTTWAVHVIGRQTELLARLLDDLLDVARIARGKVTLETAPVELSVLVARSVEICQPLVDMRRHALRVEVPAEPLWVEGDLMRLTQVLANLLTNAAKYMDEGGQIVLQVTQAGSEAEIRVRDTGMGMKPELLALVFEPFMQADATLDRSRGGLGLGLTLVKQLVELHGGTVEARSPGLGQGSEFIVRLPLLQLGPDGAHGLGSATEPPEALTGGDGEAGHPEGHEAADARAEAAPEGPPPGRCRVLIVDDNRDAARSMALLMQSAGHQVRLAFDGQEALSVAGRWQPQLAILDIGLPGLDGYQVARRLKGARATAHTRLVALTGYGQPEDLARAQAAGFDRHFVKPVDPQAILDLAACAPT